MIELEPAFGGLIAFVKRAEQLVERNESTQLEQEKGEDWRHSLRLHWRFIGKVQKLLDSFSKTWKQQIGEMNSDIMRSFTNFKVECRLNHMFKCIQSGTAILQEALTQMVMNYEKFVALLKKVVWLWLQGESHCNFSNRWTRLGLGTI